MKSVSCHSGIPDLGSGRTERRDRKNEVDMISLVAPSASIIIIKDTEVIKKMKVSLPKTVKELVKCGNPNCITNSKEPKEPVVTEFIVEKKPDIRLRCLYCDRFVEDIEDNLA